MYDSPVIQATPLYPAGTSGIFPAWHHRARGPLTSRVPVRSRRGRRRVSQSFQWLSLDFVDDGQMKLFPV